MIYLDNSATTRIKPKSVINEVIRGLTKLSSNPGRSGHIASLNSAIEVGNVREKISKYFCNDKPENVVFTQNCTDALNLAILGTIKKGGHVITTVFEHNSILRPLNYLKMKGLIELSIVEPKLKNIITKEDIEKEIKTNTYLIATTHISNVDGAETDIESIGKLCEQYNIIYLVDSAQSAGHKLINMQKQKINLLAVAGHKSLFGPQGIGVLLINGDIKVNPIRFGGTGTESISLTQPSQMPECLESGTIALPNILGLGAGIDFVNKNKTVINKKIEKLTKILINELKKRKNLKIYTHEANLNGVVAFNILNIDSTIVSEFLNDKYQICVRSGLHCAPLKHKYLRTTEQGIIRVSVSYFTTYEEIKQFLIAIDDFIKLYLY